MHDMGHMPYSCSICCSCSFSKEFRAMFILTEALWRKISREIATLPKATQRAPPWNSAGIQSGFSQWSEPNIPNLSQPFYQLAGVGLSVVSTAQEKRRSCPKRVHNLLKKEKKRTRKTPANSYSQRCCTQKMKDRCSPQVNMRATILKDSSLPSLWGLIRAGHQLNFLLIPLSHF